MNENVYNNRYFGEIIEYSALIKKYIYKFDFQFAKKSHN
jgi:hypothetical protein